MTRCPAVMEIDTLGTFQMSRAAHKYLKQGGGGSVVNISATLHYGATFYQVWTTFYQVWTQELLTDSAVKASQNLSAPWRQSNDTHPLG